MFGDLQGKLAGLGAQQLTGTLHLGSDGVFGVFGDLLRHISPELLDAHSLGFALQQSQAVIFNEASGQLGLAKIENGQLQIDFAKASFFTQFDLVSQKERISLQNKGEVAPDGKPYGGSQFSRPNNMDVRGALASDNRSAVILFQSRLDALRVASGATLWGR